MLSKYVASVTVTDPDTKLPCEVEIRKLEDGTLVGIDSAWLEQTDGAVLTNPYDLNSGIEIPHDENVKRVEIGN